MFYVPLGRSGDVGIGAEDQHSFIVQERCQPLAPHDGPTLWPRQYIQREEVGEIPTSLLRVPGHGPHGYTRRGHDTLQVYNLQKIRNRLPTSSGAPPFGQRAWSAPGPTIDQGTPRAPYNNLRKQTSHNFTYRLRNTWKHLGTGKAIKTSPNLLQVTQYLKTLELGKSPSRPQEQSYV